MSPDAVIKSMVLAALLFWGAWGIFDKKALAHTTPFTQLIAIYCFAPLLAIATAVALNMVAPGWHLSTHVLFWEGLGAVAYFLATGAYMVAMSKGEASLILGATACYPVVTQILATLFLGESLAPARVIGCIVIVAGVLAIGKSSNRPQPAPSIQTLPAQADKIYRNDTSDASRAATALLTKPETMVAPPVAPPIPARRFDLVVVVGISLAVLGWAIRGIFDKIATDQAHPLEVSLARYVFDTVLGAAALLWMFRTRTISTLSNRALWPYATGSALCLAGGSAAYYIALSMASVSYVVAITGCYPLVMYLLAIVVLRERFNVPRVLGILLITLGGILTQTTQNI